MCTKWLVLRVWCTETITCVGSQVEGHRATLYYEISVEPFTVLHNCNIHTRVSWRDARRVRGFFLCVPRLASPFHLHNKAKYHKIFIFVLLCRPNKWVRPGWRAVSFRNLAYTQYNNDARFEQMNSTNTNGEKQTSKKWNKANHWGKRNKWMFFAGCVECVFLCVWMLELVFCAQKPRSVVCTKTNQIDANEMKTIFTIFQCR